MVDFLLANDIARWLFLGVVFAAMMMIVFTVIGSMSRRSAVRAELKTLETRGPGGQVARLSHAKQTAWTRLADRIWRRASRSARSPAQRPAGPWPAA